MAKKKYKIFDVLRLEKINPDSNRYYNGSRGRYLFIFSTDKGRIGDCILNRVFLTGLFKPKYPERYPLWVGDVKDKFLAFRQGKNPDVITIYQTPKKKDTE